MNATDVMKALQALADPEKARFLQGFFKTGKGDYAEGDRMLGIKVPPQRAVARKFQDISLAEVTKLLASDFHEHRFVALEILVMKYEKAEAKEKRVIVSFYLKNRKRINNWDLVDTSAPYILGDYLLHHDRTILKKLAVSKNLWDRRTAIVSTWALIRGGEFADTLQLAEMLLHDKEDLIHKASGWMLREVGKKSESTLYQFLDKHSAIMPRTMLRYAVERFPEKKRKSYLSMKKMRALSTS